MIRLFMSANAKDRFVEDRKLYIQNTCNDINNDDPKICTHAIACIFHNVYCAGTFAVIWN